jgi:hypothetical protein
MRYPKGLGYNVEEFFDMLFHRTAVVEVSRYPGLDD